MILALIGCEDSAAVERAQQHIRDIDLPRVQALIQQDLENHQAGVVKAAAKLAPGFALANPAARESQVRAALRILQQPKRGIDEFVASPMSFLAAIGLDGVVIARDREPDRMAGQDFKSRFEVVRQALGGTAATALGEFYAEDPNAPSSWSILFAAPSLRAGKVVGAVLAGIPLSRLAQRLSRQFRVEQKKGARVWVYLYKGDRIFHWDTPPRRSRQGACRFACRVYRKGAASRGAPSLRCVPARIAGAGRRDDHLPHAGMKLTARAAQTWVSLSSRSKIRCGTVI
jgi:hypothetical protein